MWAWLLDKLGVHEGDWYHLWSGIVPSLTVFGAVGVGYFNHACGEPGCWRWGRHKTPEGWRCRRHKDPLPRTAEDWIREVRGE